MNTFKRLFLVGMALFPLFAVGQTIPKNWPKEFLYQNQPIDPLCIYEAKDAETLVDLKKCGLEAERGLKITGHSTTLEKQGFFGYEYRWPGNTPIGGYSYYRVLGKMGDRSLILSFNNTGGSGDFSGLSAVERVGHSIKVESLINGDRCNNGITTASITNNELSYSLNITPADYLSLTQLNPNHLKAYDDLAACAACCQGVANFKVSNLDQLDNPTLMSVDLGDSRIVPDKNSQGIYQYCFDQLLATYQTKNQILSPDLLKEFVQKFNDEFVKNS
jgi:hypothetical protein